MIGIPAKKVRSTSACASVLRTLYFVFTACLFQTVFVLITLVQLFVFVGQLELASLDESK